MDSVSHNILFVIEGSKEESVVRSLETVFFDKKTIITLVFGTVIYALYKAINEDADLEVFPLLKKRVKGLENYNRNSFSDIYLFFDYDAHATNASDVKMEKLLNTFDNETENGKLYVSYPMLESLKHYRNFEDFKILTAKCSPEYKKEVNNYCSERYIDFKMYDRVVWIELLRAHLYKMNYIVADSYNFPTQYFSQLSIFEKQLEKYLIKTEKRVAVLSAFPIFVYDYFGNEKISKFIN